MPNKLPQIILFSLFALLLLINPVVAANFDDIYLKPRVLWIYAIVLPVSLACLWQYCNYSIQILQTLAGKLLLGFTFFIGLAMLTHPSWPTFYGLADRADGVAMHLVYVVVALTGFTLAQQDKIKDLLGTATLIGGGLLALSSILQQFGLLGVIGEGAYMGVSPTLYGGLIGNRGYLGGALALLMPIALWAVIQKSNWWRFILATLIVWTWAACMARGAWLAGGMALLCWFYWYRPNLKSLGPLFSGLALFSIMIISPIFQQDLSDKISDTDASGRGLLWTAAIYAIREQPLFGSAPPALYKPLRKMTDQQLFSPQDWENIESYIRLKNKPHEPPIFAIKLKDGSSELFGFYINKSHNEYLDYAMNYGIPAALLFIALLGLGIWNARLLDPTLAAALVAYALYVLTWPEIIRFAPIAWFILGLALASNFKPRTISP